MAKENPSVLYVESDYTNNLDHNDLYTCVSDFLNLIERSNR